MKPLRALSFAIVLALAAGGCGILPKKSNASLYSPQIRVQPDPSWPRVDWQLAVMRPVSEQLVDSTRILVRPGGSELQVYKDAVWSQPAPDMLQDAIVRALEDCACTGGVGRRGSGVAGDYDLLLDIRRFDADYAGAASPSAVVEVGAKLVSGEREAVVSSQVFRASVPAAATDVATVTGAFERAIAQVSRDIVGWTLAEGQRSARRR